MVDIPAFTNQMQVPVGRGALADPNGFAAPGEALARGGAALSDEMASFEARYADARRQADAANITAAASAKLGDAQFRWSKTPDRKEALDGFNGEAQQLRDDTLGGIKDPLVLSYVTRALASETTARSLDTGNAAFQLESAKRRGDLDTNLANYAQSAASTTNPLLKAQLTDNGIAAIRGAVAAGWENPENGPKRELQFKSDIAEVGVRQALNAAIDTQDPDAADRLAQAIDDPGNFPGLTPEKREILGQHIENVAYRLGAREAARIAHQDAEADKLMRQTQSFNETRLLSDVYSGKPVDQTQLEQLAYGQQISPAGLEAVHAAIDRRTAGHDEPLAAAHLWAALGEKTAGSEDIYAALKAGTISGETSKEMMRTLTERDKQGSDALERGAFATLKTALSGGAIENGFIKFDNAAGAHAVQAWAQAQGEWNRRVILDKEDPLAVLNELAPKYSGTIQRPSWLPAPKFGNVNSLDDVRRAYVSAKSQLASKAMSQSDFESQAQLLESYRVFYAEKAIRDSAAIQIPFAKPGAGRPKLKLDDITP